MVQQTWHDTACLLFQVSGHFDYARKMESILEVIGVETKQYVASGAADSIREWCTLHRTASSSNSTRHSPDTDDETEMGIEAEYFTSAENFH
jgi:hypothetical protein